MNSTPQGHPHIVIDVNCLRDDKRIREAAEQCRQQSLTLLIPDGVGFEIGKVFDDGAGKIQKSLQHFRSVLDVVSFSYKLEDMRKRECEVGMAASSLVNDDLTIAYQNLIESGNDWEQIQKNIDELMPASVEVWADHEKLKSVSQIAGHILPQSSAEFQSYSRRLRNNNPEIRAQTFIELLSSQSGLRFVRDYLAMQGLQEPEIHKFIKSPSITTAFAIGMAALAFRFKFQGFPKNEEVQNSFHDLEYAIYAALSGARLVTGDRELMSLMRKVAAVSDAFRNGHSVA